MNLAQKIFVISVIVLLFIGLVEFYMLLGVSMLEAVLTLALMGIMIFVLFIFTLLVTAIFEYLGRHC